MKLQSKIALITGASAGIGEAVAATFAANGADVILTARREDRISALAANLSEKYGVRALAIGLDVRDNNAVENKLGNLPDEWRKIDILVNNAGLARGLDKIHEANLDDWNEMVDTNIKGLLYVSRVILPGMAERGNGFVINIGSIAGREVYPKGSVYCGTKHAVKALSQGMVIDLNGTGVRVCNIEPGMVETEFSLVRFHGDAETATKVYQSFIPLTPADIADIALFVATRPPHVMIQDVLVTPTAQATAMIADRK